ncbi:MAG TPA: glycosyltransferase family 2 protein [Lacibacter sp.]|nr:glycosyltransferase family 2 protein [Lacibacter sp.]HMO90084.1 glycosyltransferase family 2 protein [Lacibacter sp.]HMP87334.1 glycosyltransferase family 2 protein [Lacibacter sp.]
MHPASVYVIIPCYNEDPAVLRATLQNVLQEGYRLVLVDDGSVRPPAAACDGLPVHLLRHPVNLGQGAALQTGMDYALQQGAAWLVHFDADGQHRAADIAALLQPLEEGRADVALGSRFLGKQSNGVPLLKRVLIFAARYVNYLFTGILLTDAHNGLRAFGRTAAEKIRITENRMAHASELLFLVKKHRLRYCEVPVTVMYTPYARNKGQSAWNSIRIFFDLLLHKLFS